MGCYSVSEPSHMGCSNTFFFSSVTNYGIKSISLHLAHAIVLIIQTTLKLILQSKSWNNRDRLSTFSKFI